jgi:putative DNA primase/helicase
MISNPLNSIAHSDAEKNQLLSAALGYAGCYQWRVFPVYGVIEGCCACSGITDKCAPGKHPITKNGFYAATTNTDRIEAWWREWPWANIGAPTGQKSGFVILDVDPRHGGLESLTKLEARNRTLETLTATTGSGGTHYFFLPPEMPLKSDSTGSIAAGIGTRAEGGYVLLAPSKHISGGSYCWSNKRPPAPMPDWLLDLWPKQGVAGGRQGAPAILGDIPDGHRSATLTSWAGSMRKRGMSEAAILAALLVENETRCKPPLSEEQVRAIASGMTRYPLGAPAPLPKSYNPGAPTKTKRGGTSIRYTSRKWR